MLVLRMNFQPLFMSGMCLRKVDRSLWTSLQKEIVPAKRPACSLCGFIAETKRSLIHADEVWSFPQPPHVVLVNIRPLCINCHDAKDYADYLRRVAQGIASPSRSIAIIEHYCSVNDCSHGDFDGHFKVETERIKALNASYRWNVDKNVAVDYGIWDRPADKPRLAVFEKHLVKEFYRDRDGPIIVGGTSLGNFGAAVRYIQALPKQNRPAIFEEMKEFVLEEYEDDDVLLETEQETLFQSNTK